MPPDAPPATTNPPTITYRLIALIALMAGVFLYLSVERFGTRHWKVGFASRVTQLSIALSALGIAVALVIVMALLKRRPALTARGRRLATWVSAPSPRARRFIALALGAISCLYLYYTARWQGHDLGVRIHDENMYMVQAQTLAHGHLWMPQHPYPEFFESFHVFARPVYGAMYFPGTGLFYAIPVRLGIPTWIFSLALTGLAIGLVYLVITELIDGLSGLLAALLMLSISSLRYFSVMLMSHPLLLALGMLMVLSVLRWRISHRRGWLILLGAASGWAAITRPVDAVCYAIPLGLLMLWELRRLSWARQWLTAAIVTLAALPFLCLQGIMNYGFTGRVAETPVQKYLQTYWPEMQMGKQQKLPPGPGVIFPRYSMGMMFEEAGRIIRWWEYQSLRPRLAARLPTRLPQFADFYLDFVIPAVHTYQATDTETLARDRVRTTFLSALPSSALVIFLPAAVLGLSDPRRWALAVVPVIFFFAYFFFAFYLDHYVLVVAPAIVFLCLLGVAGLRRAAAPAGAFAGRFMVMVVALLALAAFPEFRNGVLDQPAQMFVLRDVNARLAALPSNERALVFFRYHPEEAELWKQEPVYTLDAPYPDQARIVRAHDLGPHNADLIDYYARIQPDRRCYLFDLQSRQITSLGLARDLARR